MWTIGDCGSVTQDDGTEERTVIVRGTAFGRDFAGAVLVVGGRPVRSNVAFSVNCVDNIEMAASLAAEGQDAESSAAALLMCEVDDVVRAWLKAEAGRGCRIPIWVAGGLRGAIKRMCSMLDCPVCDIEIEKPEGDAFVCPHCGVPLLGDFDGAPDGSGWTASIDKPALVARLARSQTSIDPDLLDLMKTVGAAAASHTRKIIREQRDENVTMRRERDAARAEAARLREACEDVLYKFGDQYEGRFERLRAALAEGGVPPSLPPTLLDKGWSIAKREMEVARLRAIVDGLTWSPISEHPREFWDGDLYLVSVPVRDRHGNHHDELYFITACTDAEAPTTFKDASGETWDVWDWDDVEFYIRNPKFPSAESAKAEGGAA